MQKTSNVSRDQIVPTTRADRRSRLGDAVRLALVVGALVGAVLLAPIGSEITGGDDAEPVPTIEPSRLSVADQRVLAAGKGADNVGDGSPEITFTTFDGSSISLHGRTRPVVLMFFDEPCRECDQELGKLAVIGTIAFEDAWVGALASPEAGDRVRQGVIDAGGTDLFYAGTDDGGAIARSLGVERTPATVVLDENGRIAAVWQRSIPAGVVLELVRAL